jgi:dolichol kinase
MCISSRGTLVMYISSRDIWCTLCIDISKLTHLGHMVYRRVSNLFDYTLHVLVPCDRHLDISMLSMHILHCILLPVHAFFIHIILCVFLCFRFFEMYPWFFVASYLNRISRTKFSLRGEECNTPVFSWWLSVWFWCASHPCGVWDSWCSDLSKFCWF